MFAGVADAIAKSGGKPGGIASGLSDAIKVQMEQGRQAREIEGLPVAAAASRSRYNTYAQQDKALGDVYMALMSRGEVDATVEGRIKEVRASLDQNGQMTMQGLAIMEEILREAVVNNKMTVEEKADMMDQLTRGVAGRAGYRRIEA